jgi:hypothetical protein
VENKRRGREDFRITPENVKRPRKNWTQERWGWESIKNIGIRRAGWALGY